MENKTQSRKSSRKSNILWKWDISDMNNPISEFIEWDKNKAFLISKAFGIKVRNTNALFVKKNSDDNEYRLNIKTDKKSRYYPDKIIAVSRLMGIIKTYSQALKYGYNKMNLQDWIDYAIENNMIVHHIDGDSLNDCPKNLILLTKNQHRLAHYQQIKRGKQPL